ncbi:MAG: hypothetical protein LBU43_07705 [Candidatus Accumulibacter sp.]|nr:hypothetical protein [Accumulibacter sp.]
MNVPLFPALKECVQNILDVALSGYGTAIDTDIMIAQPRVIYFECGILPATVTVSFVFSSAVYRLWGSKNGQHCFHIFPISRWQFQKKIFQQFSIPL